MFMKLTLVHQMEDSVQQIFNADGKFEDEVPVRVKIVSHAQMHIGPDANNAALRIQIKAIKETPTNGPPTWTLQADALDYGQQSTVIDETPPVTSTDEQFKARYNIGQITNSNTDFIDDSNNGAGIMRDILTDPNGPFASGTTVGIYQQPNAGCAVFVQELEKKLFPGVPTNADLAGWLQDKEHWFWVYESGHDPEPVKITSSKIMVMGDSTKNQVTRYTINGPGELQLEYTNKPQGADVAYADEVTNMDPSQQPLLDPLVEQNLGTSLTTADGGTMGDACRRVRRNRYLEPRCTAAMSTSDADTGSTEMVFARVNKVLSTMTLVAQDAAEAAGAAGVVLAAAFVILDFVDGNWVGGAFGAAVSI